MRNLIKNYFKGYSKKGIVKNFSKFLRNNPEVEKYLNNVLIENPNWESIKNIVYGICFNEELKCCKNCGKEMKYSQMKFDSCSYKCRANSKEFQEKIKQINLERYGCECSLQNKEVQEKTKQTNLEKYCHEHPMQSEKVKQIFHDNSYDNFILSFIQYGVAPLFPKEEYVGYDKTYRWKCIICGNEFEQKIYPTSHVKECPYLPHCWNCYPRMSGESKSEFELLDFVKQYFPNAHKDNELIKPQELDIVIDELKLAVEFNGDYWHSTEFYLEHHDSLDEFMDVI